MDQAESTYRASVAYRITGVPPHSQRTWRKLGLLTADKERLSWTEHTVGDLVTLVVTRNLAHRFGLDLEHAAKIGRAAAAVGLGQRRRIGKQYGEYRYLVVTDPGGEILLRNAAGISWDLQVSSETAIVVDAISATQAVINSLRAEGQKVPEGPWK